MVNANLNTSPAEVRYGGFGVRLKAFAFDYLPIAAYIILLIGLTMAVTWVMNALGRPVSWPECEPESNW